MTKEIPQALARRMAAFIRHTYNGRPDLPGARDAAAILAGLPQDDPFAEAVAWFTVQYDQPNCSGHGTKHWRAVKAALAERPGKSEAWIRADEREKAEREIGGFCEGRGQINVALAIRGGDYRKGGAQ